MRHTQAFWRRPVEPALSGDSCSSCHSKGHSSHSSVASARVSCLVVPVEEMNLETLDFATLDFNKDGFVCSLRRKPKNDVFGSMVRCRDFDRHRNSGGSSNRVWDGILIPLFHLVPPVFSYLGRMEGRNMGLIFGEKKGKGMGNDQCANRLDGEFFEPDG